MLERGLERAQQLRDNKNAVRQFAIAQARGILQAAGVVDPRLDVETQPAGNKSGVKPEATPKIDLRQQTYDLLPLVREPSTEEKAALEQRGLVFLPVQAKSYVQVVAEDPDYFWPNELQYAKERAELRDFTPPVMEVALNVTQLALPDSFNKSRAVQLMMIERYSQEKIEKDFPGAKAIMLPVTAYAQADRAYKQRTREVLFRTYFARGLDNISEVNAASAGRDAPDYQFDVRYWNADLGLDPVGAIPAVVFIRK